ncbi:MAG: hypothetical protein U1E02_43475, partial [Hydrogenophaga sp.]|nr:hypothetical protein [Hydrogenophaga sp.]
MNGVGFEGAHAIGQGLVQIGPVHRQVRIAVLFNDRLAQREHGPGFAAVPQAKLFALRVAGEAFQGLKNPQRVEHLVAVGA